MSEPVDFSRLPEPVCDDFPDFVRLHDLAWRLAAQHVIRHPTSGRPFVDVAWNLDDRLYEWVWDSCFIALYCRYAPDQFPGLGSLDNFYDLQRDDGYISMTYDLRTGQEPYPDRINPPLFAWVEWEYYLTTGDASRFGRVVPHIERLMDWIDRNRRPEPWQKQPSPLYYFRDCGSSGMDDSPRTPRHPEAGRFFEWVDLSAQMALSFRCLAEMNAALGRADRAEHWRQRWDVLGRAINDRLWCERTRFYHDRNISRRFVTTKTAAAFWPLLAGVCSEGQKDALVAHLDDEREFDRPTPVPTLSADDPNYSPDGEYWIGGVWPPTNYMIARGLVGAGRGDVAHGIAVRYLGALARTYDGFEPHTLWECNSPESDRPGLTAYAGRLVKPDFVGWTGIGPIAMLIENVLGIEPNAPAKRIEWTIRLTGRHGVERLALGALGRVDLLCEARRAADDEAKVSVRADSELEVVVRCGGRVVTVRARPGKTISLHA